jgi:hypothetical protein
LVFIINASQIAIELVWNIFNCPHVLCLLSRFAFEIYHINEKPQSTAFRKVVHLFSGMEKTLTSPRMFQPILRKINQ